MSDKKRILILEDEASIALLLEDMVDALGYRVTASVSTLPAAWAQLEARDFDMGLLDLNLHGQSSLEFASALAERAIPFAFVTGYGPAAITGFDSVPLLQKPYTAKQLGAVLKALLPAKP